MKVVATHMRKRSGRILDEDQSETSYGHLLLFYPGTYRFSNGMLYAVLQEITRHAETVEDCSKHATLYAECHVKAKLLRGCDP
jgi:hypothetical protein